MSTRRKGKGRPPDDIGIMSGGASQEVIDTMMAFMNPKGPYLLGVDWCHIPRKAKILSRDGHPIQEGWYVEENTGMAGVIPAWKIRDILDDEEFKMQRKIADDHLTGKKNSSKVTLDSSDNERNTLNARGLRGSAKEG